MKAQTAPYFVLQEVITAALHQRSCAVALTFTNDFIAPQCLAGSPRPIQHILDLLIPELVQSGAGAQVKVRPLLQTGKEVLIEFSIAQNKGKEGSLESRRLDPVSLAKAEEAIKSLGGSSERIQLNGAGGLKFILKWSWVKPEDAEPRTELTGRYTGKRILVAEDNEVNGECLSRLLSLYGGEVDLVPNGKNAIDTLTRNLPYDLILMDLQLPHMDGWETANFIRKKLASTVPIIGMSAAPLSLDVVSNSGLQHIIEKWTVTEALPSLLSRFLGSDSNYARKREVAVMSSLIPQWSEHRIAKTYKHTVPIHQHRPAL